MKYEILDKLSKIKGKTIESTQINSDEITCIKFTDKSSILLEAFNNYGDMEIGVVKKEHLTPSTLRTFKLIDNNQFDMLMSVKNEQARQKEISTLNMLKIKYPEIN